MLPLPPVYYAGAVYQSAWSVGNPQQLQINTWQTDPLTGAANNLWYTAVGPWPGIALPTTAPIVANLRKPPQYTESAPALVFSSGQAVYGLFLDGYGYVLVYSPAELVQRAAYTNMLLVDGNIFFADSAGNLYGLDAAFNPLPDLPATLVDANIYAPLERDARR